MSNPSIPEIMSSLYQFWPLVAPSQPWKVSGVSLINRKLNSGDSDATTKVTSMSRPLHLKTLLSLH